jgi:hypothetical protein
VKTLSHVIEITLGARTECAENHSPITRYDYLLTAKIAEKHRAELGDENARMNLWAMKRATCSGLVGAQRQASNVLVAGH